MTVYNEHSSKIILFFLFFSICALPLTAQEGIDSCEPCVEECESEASRLMRDLLTVNYWNERLNRRFPVLYNHLLQGGYFSMPSARMGQEGEIGIGYGYIPPYTLYNLRVQLVDFLEISGNYRIFQGVKDPVLTAHGFGDFSDKGANIKVGIISPEASRYALPGFAFGLEDFMGTKAFHAYYLVFTQVLLKQHAEFSVGWGSKRIRGFFGGFTWMPFLESKHLFLRPLALSLEYDAIPYSDENLERHPKGRKKSSPWQFGCKYRAFDCVDLSFAYIRGEKWAFTVSSFYNFGTTKGLIPKLNEIQPYKAPVNFEPIGARRQEAAMIQEFLFAFADQGFYLSEGRLCDECGRRVLRLKITNLVYRDEHQLRIRLNALLSSLVPDNLDAIVVVIDATALPVQEIYYEASFLRLFKSQEIGHYELNILTPYREVSPVNIYTSKLLFHQGLDWWNLEVTPKVQTLFGSASGKFKYALGVSVNVNGFVLNNVFYSITLGYYFNSYLKTVTDVDKLNPSQIINVRTDVVNYYKQKSVTVDEAFLEKMWNFGKGWYSRISLGFFEPEYGGVAAEWLYYPVNSPWAIGMEAALVKKRAYDGVFNFTSYARKLHGLKINWVKFLGTQYFLNLYYNWRCRNLDFKVSIGKFLADDFGVQTEISKYFESGLRIGVWYTYTNANDRINNSVYHDKGVFVSVPLDIFYLNTSRSRWNYGVSAWLRDVGVTAVSGSHLYDLINEERQ